MASFPAIGKVLLPGDGERPDSALLRTEMEDGPAKQARVRSRVSVKRNKALRLSVAEFNTFKTFFNTTIARGADWFDWVDPLTGTSKQARIVNGDYTADTVSAGEGAPVEVVVSFVLETLE